MKKKILALLLSAACLFAFAAPAYAMEFEQAPTPRWFRPLAAELFYMYQGISNGNVFNDSLLVLHEGKIVYERYACGRDESTAQPMFSVTKSVLSAMVGVAIGDGYITGVDQKVIGFFPDAVIEPGQESKRDMTIEHLLQQRSGLPGDSDDGHVIWWEAEDTGLAALMTPQHSAPGTRFSYSSGPGCQTLSAVIQRAAGMNLFEYAQLKLFGPLGMDSVVWDAPEDGLNYGGFGISMTPRDMLRFGYLFLNNGNWNGQQIIPADYVAASAPPAGTNHGYLFWEYLNQPRHSQSYSASGAFGQFIIVMPEHEVVIVRTGSPGPMTRTVNRLAYESALFEFLFMSLVLPLTPLNGVPLDYFRGMIS